METVVQEAREGVYLTDEKRLVEVVGQDKDGKFMLADCSVSSDETAKPIIVDGETLVRDWRVVR